MDHSLSSYVRDTFATALESGYIQVYYQPVIRSISCKLCSFEALARWIDPERGVVRPDQFIPVLEDMRTIHLLDSYVIRRACAVMRQSINRGDVPVPISVNLSRLDFELCDIFEVVTAAVNEYQIPRDFLYIEITESIMAAQDGRMREVIERFHAAGFQIWMDDFGSGYSSLNVLKDFAFDEVKLDMHFLSSFDQRSRRIMTSVIQMAKEISIHTLTEGVETEEQFEYLRNIGCEKVQGYYFGRPLPYEESLAHLASTGIDIERPAERAYYDRIGMVDFLSAVPFMTQEEKDSLTSARQLNSIPLAVAEGRADSFSVLFYNTAFRDTARGTGLFANIFTRGRLRKPQPYSLLPSRVINLMDSTRSGEEGRMFFVSNEEYYEIQAKCIAQTRDAYCVLLRMSNLSKVSESKKRSALDEGVRQLYAMYERITLFDAEADTIMPLYVATRENLVSGRTDIRRLLEEYAERLIFPDDQKDFLAFTDLSTIEERLDRGDHISVSGTFRTSVRHGRYAWKQYTILRLRPHTYLELIRNVDGEVADFRARELALSHGFGASEQAVSEELVWKTVLDSGIIHLFWKDTSRRFLGASKGFLDYYGFDSVDQIRGKNDEELGWHVQPGHYRNDELSVINEGIATCNEPGHCIRNGENRDILASKVPLYDENGQIQGLVGYFIDKDLLEENDSRGSETKRRDILTGLLNSRGIHEEARIFRDEYFLRGVDFVRVDVAIDDIESLNTQYGYDFGDKAIVGLGHALKRSFGVTASVGRTSGHQFAILRQLHGQDEEREIIARAKRVAADFRRIGDLSLTLYVSVGACKFSEVENIEEQAKRAEVRLLVDHDEHVSVKKRQKRASEVFYLFDQLPIPYAVYKVSHDEAEGVRDASLFYVNRAFEELSGYQAAELLGKRVCMPFSQVDDEWYDLARRAALKGEHITTTLRYPADGRDYLVTASPIIHSGYCCFTYQQVT